MLRDTSPPARLPRALPILFGGLLLLGGCGMMPGQPGPAATAPPPAPSDPVVAFAATAQPGAQSRVVLAGGATPVRLVRSYHAASGRECREVLVGAGAAARSQVVCQSEAEGWTSARPLLRGSGTQRR